MQQLKSGSFLQGGKYKIEKVLGQGGFGITYLAIQELLDRKVCIKEFFFKEYCERDEATSQVSLGTTTNRELVERFMEKFIKEARTISTLNHPHIIRIYDIFKENNTAYYVMEYLEGESLAELVKQRGALPEDMAVDYIKQVASALDFVHQHSINHLDVKPANVMVRKEDNQAVLIDFGLSKQYDASGEQTSTTPVGISHGYAPMEQYNVGGVGTFSPQTDIYSLGATLYKLVTGNTPPQAIEIFNDGLPELLSNVSSPIREVIKKSMQPKKAERYNSIKDFILQLDRKEESVLCDKEETILVQAPNPPKQTEPILTSNKSEKTSNYSVALICSFLLLVGIIVWGISVFTKDESSQMKNSAMVAVEMEQQRINDSIVIVRQQDAEERRKDSIDALNEQARLATIRKLEEEKKRKEQKKQGSISDGNLQKEENQNASENVFDVVEELPEFPGGLTECVRFVNRNIVYPKVPQEKGIQGRVIVQFIIDKDGSIVSPKVIQSIHPDLDKEALRVISIMPKWEPGKIQGKVVKCKFRIPITFRLEELSVTTSKASESYGSFDLEGLTLVSHVLPKPIYDVQEKGRVV